jgi:methylated-DNA-[protein]-cysteine S-methyltransferase
MAGTTLFESPIGPIGLAWTIAGISALQLPAATEAATRALLRRRGGAEQSDPPPTIGAAILRIQALLGGMPDDLADIALDLAGVTPFELSVYDLARKIPPGRTLTYGVIAARLGDPAAARAVGVALGRNPVAIIIPCHRVLAAGGADGGFSAPGGIATKRRLLEIEGAITAQPSLFSA